MIQAGHITEFSQIFDHIPRSVVANDLGTNYNRLARLITHTEQFTLEELVTLSQFFEIDSKIMVDLAFNQLIRKKGRRRVCAALLHRNKQRYRHSFVVMLHIQFCADGGSPFPQGSHYQSAQRQIVLW